MRKILIVGAGQSGLQLALSLLSHGYDVTVMSARTPDEIRNGKVMSTQAMFGPALQTERDYRLNLWEDRTPQIQALRVALSAPPGNRALDIVAPLDAYCQSVDQRLKMSAWLELVESHGGKVVIHGATTADLDGLTKLYDLVVVAAGKGDLVQLFDRDAELSPYTTPQRFLSVAYVHGMAPRADDPRPAVGFNAVPGFGELFVIPGLTLSGPCEILFWEVLPGGPLDRWSDATEPAAHLARTLELMREYVPWEYERCADGVELTDGRATLMGSYPPVVRKPVGELPGGGLVLGMADVVVANDPITGQGSNSAARCAEFYVNAIRKHGDQPFDRAFMQATFDDFWGYVRHVTDWTNAMLQPLPEHVQQLLGAASMNPTVARRLGNGFADPTDFQHWFMHPERATEYLATVS